MFYFCCCNSSTDSEQEGWDEAPQSSATSKCETTSDSSSGFEIDLDPAAKLLDEEVRSDRLPKSHLFYRLVLNTLKFATEVGNPGNQFKHDPLVRSFCDTWLIKRGGHWWTFYVLTGKRIPGKGRGSTHKFNWEDYNIPLPMPSNKGHGYIYENGLIRAYLISFLEMVFSPGSTTMPLLSRNKIQVVPVSLAKYGFALNPGFQVDRNTMAIVGGKEVFSLEFVKDNPALLHEYFKDKFVTEVQITGITTLDNKCALIIGNDFTGVTGDGHSTPQCHLARIRHLHHYPNCLRQCTDAIVKDDCDTTVCEECFSSECLCGRWKELDHVHWAQAFRRCDRCVEKDLECFRVACLNLATDCQSMVKAALELLSNQQNEGTVDKRVAFSAPNPEIVHAGKNIHRSLCNWLLSVW